MATVRFASICDVPDCGARSDEYSVWPVCSECGRDICMTHQVVNTLDEEQNKALCHDCLNMGV